MNPTVLAPIHHYPSKSLLFLELKKINGKVVIVRSNFANGNVVSLSAVRNAIAAATKEFAQN